MRIRDLSSDVCSSDLTRRGAVDGDIAAIHRAVLAVAAEIEGGIDAGRLAHGVEIPGQAQDADRPVGPRSAACALPGLPFRARTRRLRSEEHTSELQSLMRISYAVFCLKKKKQTKHTINKHTLPE